MKYIRATYLLIFFSSLITHSQTILKGEVIYEINSSNLLNFLKFDSVKKNIIRGKKLFKNEKKIEYKLVFDNNKSFFSKIEKIERAKKNFTEIIIGKGNYFTNNSLKKNILLQKEAFGENFIISIPTKKWKITQESKKIGKYICYKAITKKEIEGRWGKKTLEIVAWFTAEIPFNYGPKEYNGLPGLIIELSERGIVFTASKITLNPKWKIKIIKPSSGKKVTLEQYNKITKDIVTKNRRN